jgi:hypothetical protein
VAGPAQLAGVGIAKGADRHARSLVCAAYHFKRNRGADGRKLARGPTGAGVDLAA